MKTTLRATLAALFAAATTAFAADITINNLAQLRAFMENVRYNDFRGDTIRLTADIDCQGGRFNTGDPEHPTTFRGTFDGQGHTISNFVHEPNDRTDFGYGIAMFDYAELGATIRNLTLEGSLPETHLGAYSAPFVLVVEGPFSSLLLDNCHFRGSVTNYYQAAGLVGYVNSAEGSAILTNCSVRGSIVSTWVSTAGGLVAESAGVEAYDCSVEGEVRGGTSGGLVGEAYGNFFKPCSFERCSFEGVTGPYHASSGVNGGLVGQASNAVFRACTSVVGFDDVETAAGGAAGVTFGSTAFYDCSATVEAAVPYGRFGGFVGWTVGAETFSNCTATMTVDPVPVINTGNGTTNIYSLATGGFAGYMGSSAAIATSWCAGRVETTGSNYKGAFAGSASSGKITKSYYDSDKTSLLAVNKSAYPGVTPLTSAQMLHEENFNGFDFVATWKIDEGETTPYLLAFLVQKTGYEQWLEDNGLPGDTTPEAEAEGVPYLIRYVFDVPSGAFSPLTGITFEDGDPVVWFQSFNLDLSGVTLSILSTTNLLDWAHALEFPLPGPPFDFGGIILRHSDSAPARFFRLKAAEK